MVKIDAHQHFWQYNDREYAWISDQMSSLRRDFLPDHLAIVQKVAGWDASIAVQARQSLEETDWLLRLSDAHNHILGVVGWIDLCSKQVKQQIGRFGVHPKLVGFRHVVHDERDDYFMLREDFLNGIQAIGEAGFTFDFLLFPRHLKTALEVARMFPDQRFVIDHLAKPGIRMKVLDPWQQDMEAIAGCPNVYCKVSGLVTEADWRNWTYADFIPYLEVVFTSFGDQRIMAGSDWPVCHLAGDYPSVMGIAERFLDEHPGYNKDNVLGLTCREFYLNR